MRYEPLPVLCERIRHYRTARGLDQKELSLKLGLSKNVVSNWENGRTRPDVELLPNICDILGITLYQLYGLERPEELTDRERRLFAQVRALTPGNRRVTEDLVASLLRVQEAEQLPRLRSLPLFERPLAAGVGDPTELEERSEPILLYDTDAVHAADYVFRVNGDSMEPDYRDRDLVLVARVPEDRPPVTGEVDAFIVGNELYLKEYHPDGLWSRNPKYPPLRFDEDQNVYRIGRVLGTVDPAWVATKQDVEQYRLLYE